MKVFSIGFIFFLGSCSPFVWDEGVYDYVAAEKTVDHVKFTFCDVKDSTRTFTSTRMVYYSKEDKYLVTINDPGLPGIDSASFIFNDQKFRPVNLYKTNPSSPGSHRLKGKIDLHYVKIEHRSQQKVTRVSFQMGDDFVEEHFMVTRPVGDTIIHFREKRLFCLKVETLVRTKYYSRLSPEDFEIYNGPSILVYSARAIGPVMYVVNLREKQERWILRDISTPDEVIVSLN